jgi:hypothetical protein
MHRDWYRLNSLVAALLVPTVYATPAPVTNDNPPGVEIVARFQPGSACSVAGSVTIATSPSHDCTGADVRVNITELPSSGGPFRKSCAFGEEEKIP